MRALKRRSRAALALAAGLTVAPLPAGADWVSLSGAENAANIAEIHVEEGQVRIELEIFVDDVITFDRLILDEYLEGIERPPLEDRLRAFSAEDLRVLADGSELLAELRVFEPRLREVRPSPNAGKLNPYTGQIIPGPPDDRRVFYAELVYPFEGQPQTLTFVPPLDERGASRAAIGFIAYHRRVPVIDFRYLGGPAALHLDWDDPWYSAFEQKGLKRWQRGAVMSFLYVEPLEVRHEILARVRDVEAWMDLGLRGGEFIEPDENQPLKQRIGEFFLERDAVTIDGERSAPFLDRTAFVKYSMTGSTFLAQPEQLPIDTAMVGIILTYPTDSIAQEVTAEWGLWSDRIRIVPTDAIDPAGPFPSEVTPEDNVQVWTNYLKSYTPPSVVAIGLGDSVTKMGVSLAGAACFAALLPLGWVATRRRRRGSPWSSLLPPSLLLIAGLLIAGGVLLQPYLRVSLPRPGVLAAGPAGGDATELLDSLLRNTYRSFDFRREEDVYDRLAASVGGDLLSEVYLENRRSLAVTQAGGAQARVQEVEILDAEVEPLPGSALGMLFRARWTALGSVSHWGHIHTRENLYEAEITVEPVDGAWKITGLRVLDEKRIDAGAPRRG